MIRLRASLPSHPHTTPRILFTTSSLLPTLSRPAGPYHHPSPSFPPPYNNTQFITPFSQSFMSLPKYYDVNTKFDLTNITPYCKEYHTGGTKMLFNLTEAGEPVVTPVQTDPTLLERRGYDCVSNEWCHIVDIRCVCSRFTRHSDRCVFDWMDSTRNDSHIYVQIEPFVSVSIAIQRVEFSD